MFLYAFGISASRWTDAGFHVAYHVFLRQVGHPEEALGCAYEDASCLWPSQDGWGDYRAMVHLIDRTSIDILGSGRTFATSGFSMHTRKTEGHIFYDYTNRVDIVRGSTESGTRDVVLQDMLTSYPPHKGWDQHDALLVEITPADFKAGTHAPFC